VRRPECMNTRPLRQWLRFGPVCVHETVRMRIGGDSVTADRGGKAPHEERRDLSCSTGRHYKMAPRISGHSRPRTLQCCSPHGVRTKAVAADAPQLSLFVSEVETLYDQYR
jgi:hypothetical protein